MILKKTKVIGNELFVTFAGAKFSAFPLCLLARTPCTTTILALTATLN